MDKFYLIIVGSFLALNMHAQELNIGDSLPNLTIENVLNYHSDKLSFGELKGKVILIDFWGTFCKACFESFPTLDSIQEEFPDKIQILLVNTNSKDSTLNFFKKNKKIHKPHVPLITNDTILHKLFRHKIKPHHVWIDRKGIIRHVTNHYNTTKANIEKFLENGNLTGAIKKDVFDFQRGIPLIAEGNGRWLNKVEYFSYFMHSVRGVSAGNGIIRTEGKGLPNYLSQNGQSAKELITLAFSENGKYNFEPTNTVLLNVDEQNKFEAPSDRTLREHWDESNSWNYQLMVPVSQADKLFSFMQEDVQRFFNVKVFVKKKKIPCMVLKRSSKKIRLVSKGEFSSTNFFAITDDSIRHIRNGSFQILVNRLRILLQNKDGSKPLIDETKIGKSKVDLQMPSTLFEDWNLNEINKEFKKYGLKIVEKFRKQHVLIIEDA